MQWVTKDKIIVMKDVERHHNLTVGAQLHPTIEPAVEPVQGEGSAFHNALSVDVTL